MKRIILFLLLSAFFASSVYAVDSEEGILNACFDAVNKALRTKISTAAGAGITMGDDAWIGESATATRILFDSSGSIIDIDPDANSETRIATASLQDNWSYQMAGDILDILTDCRLMLVWTGTFAAASTESDLSSKDNTATFADTTTANQINKGLVWAGAWGTGPGYATVVDAADLSFIEPVAFSVGAWIQAHTSASNKMIFVKGANTAYNNEYLFLQDSNEMLSLQIFDQSVSKLAYRISNAALSDGWRFVVATYDGGGGATAANGITFYVDGVLVASTATNDASYVAMEDLALNLGVYAENDGGNRFSNNAAMCFIEASELSAANIWKLYIKTRGYYNL